MIELTANEARVLGVLIEKAVTTPEQYPLSLNATTNGANQKNNRVPVLTLEEDAVFEALEGLREKKLAVRVDQLGSRVPKYRHNAGEVLHVRPGELAILAELMLRGPQTVGELRGRASRMSELDSLETVQGLLNAMMECQEPLVRRLLPSPGTRAEKFGQLLCADSYPTAVAATPAIESHPQSGESLSQRVERLDASVESLRQSLNKLAEKLGETDLLA